VISLLQDGFSRASPQVSGISGDGMADLLSLACDLSQKMLGPQLVFKNVLEAMVMEVKAIHGLGEKPQKK
jgi:translation initiation factor IF-2